MRAQGNVYHLKVAFVCLFKNHTIPTSPQYQLWLRVTDSENCSWHGVGPGWLLRPRNAEIPWAHECVVSCILSDCPAYCVGLCSGIVSKKEKRPSLRGGMVLHLTDTCLKAACLWGCACVQWVSLPLQCFTCSTCRNRLVPGDRFHYINGSLFCEHDRPTALINGHLNSLQSNPLLPDQKVNTQQFLISILRTGWQAEPSERRVSLACSSFTSSSPIRSVQRCSSKLPLNLLVKHHCCFWVGSLSVTSAMLNIGDPSPRRDRRATKLPDNWLVILFVGFGLEEKRIRVLWGAN